MRFLMVALLLSQAGCAGMAYNAREREDCYIARIGILASLNDSASCSMNAVFPRQLTACMYLKGYDLGECYSDNHMPVVKE